VIDILSPIVNRHATEGVSRADIFALATTVGADVKQRSNSRIDMRLKWWGRVDCEKTGQPCKDANGNTVTCSAKKGPHHEFPNINMHTHDLYSFFSDNFGFNQRDTVAIMGAHTLGVVRVEVREKCDVRCVRTFAQTNQIQILTNFLFIIGFPNRWFKRMGVKQCRI
jgi:hypothetical protein